MHFTAPTFVALVTLLAPFVSADLHHSGVCVSKTGGQNVYHDAATKAACDAYSKRNTGDKQWDQCPDCAMVSSPSNGITGVRANRRQQQVIGNLNVCHSDGWHIGGDELDYYCKQNGAGGSMSN
jgi:hypothetical protein